MCMVLLAKSGPHDQQICPKYEDRHENTETHCNRQGVPVNMPINRQAPKEQTEVSQRQSWLGAACVKAQQQGQGEQAQDDTGSRQRTDRLGNSRGEAARFQQQNDGAKLDQERQEAARQSVGLVQGPTGHQPQRKPRRSQCDGEP